MIVNKVHRLSGRGEEAESREWFTWRRLSGKDGRVSELHALSGPPLLIQAAIDAVRQWVYRPTLLNGNPVEVETTIDINFTLNQ